MLEATCAPSVFDSKERVDLSAPRSDSLRIPVNGKSKLYIFANLSQFNDCDWEIDTGVKATLKTEAGKLVTSSDEGFVGIALPNTMAMYVVSFQRSGPSGILHGLSLRT